jgi:hypothetical protein
MKPTIGLICKLCGEPRDMTSWMVLCEKHWKEYKSASSCRSHKRKRDALKAAKLTQQQTETNETMTA